MTRASKTLLLPLLLLCMPLATAGIVRAQEEAIVPTPRADRAWWMSRFYDNVRQVGAGDAELLFIGDSITHGWEDAGKETWDKYYRHRKPVNLGFSGDRTQHVLWRLIHGQLERVNPKVAVLMIGTNNSRQYTPQEIAEGVGAICNTLRGVLPETKILLLAVFPRGSTATAWQRGVNTEANTLISELDDGEWIHYLDIGDSFLQDDGVLSESVMPDALHPEELGYQIWAEAMEPALARLLGDEPVQ